MDIYKQALRPFLFSFLKTDPEFLHHQTMRFLAWLDRSPPDPLARRIRDYLAHTYGFEDARLRQTVWGIPFANPFGLAAGFDKDGTAAGVWSHLGFGFVELGTVTWHPQPGNPPPRMFRLTSDLAAINRMGFNNRGAQALAAQLQQRWQDASSPIPVGINLGKSKVTPLEAAAADYERSYEVLQGWGDYFVVNVSSPNTPGLRSLQAGDRLAPILQALQAKNQTNKPLLVKISPDLTWQELADILELVEAYHIAGIVATNTTCDRAGLQTTTIAATGNPVAQETGGLSGAPLRSRSTAVIRWIWQQTQGKIPIIGVGGIFSADDAWEKITAGATLLQGYTGLVYEGPTMVGRILQGLGQKLDAGGFSHIGEAVGSATQFPQTKSH
ncbi:quinone-dependent dihydroorotate dehydrogenase [Geitlerinema sp. PCC 9228]|uniref:quinone-dependent dihydroorotate dehydrogenase n=1 Tax=Geitlerinema sp. PCC 9228 TaxID=111611 RepID=UPI0008F9A3D6|nr:quinone-dependent dihydroorotate dehydrogenase [Geitlerinema sp. PCC 9228]